MATRAELDARARELGLDPDEYPRKRELEAAIKAADPTPPEVVKTTIRGPVVLIRGPVVLKPLTHQGRIIEPGEPVPADLSPEAVQVLIEQGHVNG